MLVLLSSLQASIAAHLGEGVAALANEALQAEAVDGFVTVEAAGRAIVASVFGSEVADASLRAVVINADDRSPVLGPETAAAHPLLTGWTAATPSDFAAAAINSGATMAYLAPHVPIFQALEVVCCGGEWEASATLSFEAATSPATAALLYGEPLLMAGISKGTRLSGDSLFEIGADAQTGRHAPQSKGWRAIAEGRAAAEAAPVPRTLH